MIKDAERISTVALVYSSLYLLGHNFFDISHTLAKAAGSSLEDFLERPHPFLSTAAAGFTVFGLYRYRDSVTHTANRIYHFVDSKALQGWTKAKQSVLAAALLASAATWLPDIRNLNSHYFSFSTSPTNPVPQGLTEDARLKWIYKTHKQHLKAAAKQENIDESLLIAIIDTEAGGNPYALSCTGAAGLMQFVVDTGKRYNLKTTTGNPTISYTVCRLDYYPTSRVCNYDNPRGCDWKNDERFNPEKSILAGAKYLKDLGAQSKVRDALYLYSGRNSGYPDTVLRKQKRFRQLLGWDKPKHKGKK